MLYKATCSNFQNTWYNDTIWGEGDLVQMWCYHQKKKQQVWFKMI
jgi:hypothetical protein